MGKGKNMKRAIALMITFVIIVSAFAGCSKKGPSTTNGKGDVNVVEETSGNQGNGLDKAKEAPILAEKVKAGTLPALEERLPVVSDVMVETDVISLGEYGGSVSTLADDNGRWGWGPWTEQGMFRFKQDGSGEVEANVCKDFYTNEDSTVWTIELREGMKWSDGQPFTADDVIFYYNHISTPALNADRSPIAVEDEGYFPAYTSKPYNCYQVTVDGVNYWAEFAKVDDYKITVTFAAPKPNFPTAVAVDNKWMFLPKHFYVNYVARRDNVADDASFPLITEEQAIANANKDFGKQWTDYSTMGKDIGYYNWDYAIVPQLRSYIAIKDNWNTVGETYELVRNPYFWKTDSEGRQLPYLDSIKFVIINDNDQRVLKQTSGEIDLSTANAADFATIATGTQNTHTPVQWLLPDWGNEPILSLNQTVKDLDKRALFQDIRFREALSISVDRNLMNATLMNGQSKPAQASVAEGAVGYDADWAAKWTELNVERANKLLDEMTEPWDGKEGTYRKMKGTNKDVEIVISIKDPSTQGDKVALLQSAYKVVGIKVYDRVDADLSKSVLVNDVEASFETISVTSPSIRPDELVPMRNFKCWYGAYGKWYEDGKSTANGGIEPTGAILELVNAYDAIKAASGENRDKIVAENVQKIYDLHKENTWVIGFIAPLPQNWFVNNNVKNFPSDIIYADEYRFANMMRAEQLYIAK
ncbi:MAG: extracellular solute-binding protein family 5 [Anaerocolumna sp.]|nr:extracellular solute-binding protein family 5 [Anaerocolumna sp.]